MHPYKGDLYYGVLRRGYIRDGECLLSNATKHKHGYRTVGSLGKSRPVHRVVYEKWNGPIPRGMVIDHICHNEAAHRDECLGGTDCRHRRCINPSHLRVAAPRENTGASPLGWKQGVFQSSKTHCRNGHEYSAANTRWGKRTKTGAGYRICITCRLDSFRRAEKKRGPRCQTLR